MLRRNFVAVCLIAPELVVLSRINIPDHLLKASKSTENNWSNSKKLSNRHSVLEAGVPINAVAWSADGMRLASLSNFGGTVTVWDASNWAVVNRFERYGGAYSQNSLVFLPDNTLLTAASVGKSPDPDYETLAVFSLIQWDPLTGRKLRYIPDFTHSSTSGESKVVRPIHLLPQMTVI